MIVRRLISLTLALGMLVTTAEVSAAPTAKERAEAKTEWAKGRTLSVQKRHDDAVAALRRAHDLDPKVQYKLDLARALIDASLLVEASERLSEIETSKEGNVQKAKSVAKKLATELDARIPSIKVKVSGPGAESAEISIDGVTVDADKATRLDPGTRIVVARGNAGQEARERVDLAEGQQHSVLLALPAATESKDPNTTETSGSGNMLPAAITYAIGGAGLAAGAVLGILAFQKTASVEEVCGGTTCPPQYTSDIAEAQDLGTGSTIAFAIGGLTVGAALILTFTVGMDDDEPAPSEEPLVSVRPVFGPGFVGAVGTF